MGSPRVFGSTVRPTPEIVRTYHERVAVDRAARLTTPTTRPPYHSPPPLHGFALAPSGAATIQFPAWVLMLADTLRPNAGGVSPVPSNTPPSNGTSPGLQPTLFDSLGNFFSRYPQCVTVPALFMTEFGGAMPLVNEAWSKLFGVDTGSHWRSAGQLAWAVPIAVLLPFILFGAQALPQKAYARIKASALDPMKERIRAADEHGPRYTKRSRRRAPRGEFLHASLDGGMAYGVNPYFRRHFGPRRGYAYSLTAELAKSAALYTATGAVLELPFLAFVPSATLLSIGANTGGAYVAQIWGSLGAPAGRILAAFTCLFFSSHAISGLEAVATQSDDIPDGIGYAAQLLVGGALSYLFIRKAKGDAASLAVAPPPATAVRRAA